MSPQPALPPYLMILDDAQARRFNAEPLYREKIKAAARDACRRERRPRALVVDAGGAVLATVDATSIRLLH